MSGGGCGRCVAANRRAKYAWAMVFQSQFRVLVLQQQISSERLINTIAALPLNVQENHLAALAKDGVACPVCMDSNVGLKPTSTNEYDSTNVVLCIRGHPVCGDCMQRVRACPLCRQPFPPLRFVDSHTPFEVAVVRLERRLTEDDDVVTAAADAALQLLPDDAPTSTWKDLTDHLRIPGLHDSSAAFAAFAARFPSHVSPAHESMGRRQLLCRIAEQRIARIRQEGEENIEEGGGDEGGEEPLEAHLMRSRYSGVCAHPPRHSYAAGDAISRAKVRNRLPQTGSRAQPATRYACAGCLTADERASLS